MTHRASQIPRRAARFWVALTAASALLGGPASAAPGGERTGGPPAPGVLTEDPDELELDGLWRELGDAPPLPTESPPPPTLEPTPTSPSPPSPARRRVLVIGIDGVRPDALQRAHTPNLSRLADEGAVSYRAEAASVTLSGPGWAALLTGVERGKHRVLNNHLDEHTLNGWPTFFGRLREARPDARTAAFVAWRPLRDFMLAPATLDERFWSRSDERVTARAVAALRDGDPTLTFVHLDHVDSVGHKRGYSRAGPAYLAAIEGADRHVGQLLAAISQRRQRGGESWLVIVTTDHGGTGRRHGANRPTDRRIFCILYGREVQRGRLPGTPRLLDITPTVLTFLGVPLDPSWQLEGRIIGLRSATIAEAREPTPAPL